MPLSPTATREYWLDLLQRLARPILQPLAAGKLKKVLPVECRPGHPESREMFAHLEAFGRLLSGIAPWLGCRGLTGPEETLRQEMLALVHTGLDHATNPTSPDYMNFGTGMQPLVDRAFLAHGLLRAWDTLYTPLSARVQAQIHTALACGPERQAFYNNWLLFASMTETALWRMGSPWDVRRLEHGVRTHIDTFYKGDGTYGDGPEFHFDYYNSYVIQPMLLDIVTELAPTQANYHAWLPLVHSRALRYATILERMISPEGTIPPIGRSLVYRAGAMQHLAQMALRQDLPASLTPGQIRSALTAVQRRLMEPAATFDAQGYLRMGFCGHQPDLGESYISTGSLYLCATALLPLGLPPEADFWTQPDQPWTSQRLYQGENLPADQALKA
jgi:hypothetical protein